MNAIVQKEREAYKKLHRKEYKAQQKTEPAR